MKTLFFALALAACTSAGAQVMLPLPACENHAPFPVLAPVKPIGLPSSLPGPAKAPATAPTDCGSPMLESNAVGGAAAFFCKAPTGAPVLYLYAVRWSAVTPAMVADFAALSLPGDNAERIRAMQEKHQTSNVFDMCDVWGPMRERINAAIPAPDRYVVAKNGAALDRPAYPMVDGKRMTTSKARALVGALCNPALTIVEGASTYRGTGPGVVALCVKAAQ